MFVVPVHDLVAGVNVTAVDTSTPCTENLKAEELSFEVNVNQLTIALEIAKLRYILEKKNGFSHRGTGSSKK